MVHLLSVLLVLLTQSVDAKTKYNGDVSFTQEERLDHKNKINEFVEVASQCLNQFEDDHFEFYDSNCIAVNGKEVCLSKFYGERRYSKLPNQVRPDGVKLEWLATALKEIGYPSSYMDKMVPNSCVGMALSCLEKAFLETDQKNQWLRIKKFTNDNGVGGVALQYALRQIGWKLYYWNPSTNTDSMAKWDAEEASWKSKGYHQAWYKTVFSEGRYWYNTVDNATDLVGFGDGEPAVLKSHPFWVGTANVGYHVFPGHYATVIEAHSTRHISSIDNLEVSVFSPMANGGGPRWTKTEKYRSGLIALPPLD